jgi:hypothetical protein
MTMTNSLMERLLEVQERFMSKHECCSCGEIKPYDEIESRSIEEGGENYCVQVCKGCIDLGWDKWGRS